MDEEIAKLYEDAPRFDEGEIIQGKEYDDIMRRQAHIEALMTGTFGPGVMALLEEHTAALYEEMELEAQHFFQEGYRAAKRE